MQNGYVKLMRSDAAFQLLERDHNAFILLCIIALRARRVGGLDLLNLRLGEALIGDFQKYGMTQGQYREAKARLERYGIATFRTTSRGTIAKLTDTSVFDSNIEPNNKPNNEPTTTEQRANNEPTTTNKNEKKGKKDIRRFQPPTIEELQIYFTAQGCSKPATEAQAFFDHFASNGWKVGGKAAMKDWKAAVRNWIRRDAEKTPPAKNDQELFKGYAL